MLRGFNWFWTTAALLFVGGLVGCSKGLPAPTERLPGKWQGQMIVYEEVVQGKLTPDQVAHLKQMQMGFEFSADGGMVLSGVNNGQAYNSQGRWEKVKEDGELLTIKSIEQSGATKDVNIEFDGADTFYVPLQTEVAELGAMRFTRLR